MTANPLTNHRVPVPVGTGTAESPERLIAQACRVLAARGLAEDILGHVSLRSGPDTLYVRSRGPNERGLLFTEPADVHLADLDGDAALSGGYKVPNELPIHREVLRARPDVQAVVLVGAYNIPAMRMAADGIPVYPRGLLINRPDLGRAVAETLGDRPVCVLRGHGIVAVGATVQQAVVRALNVTALARVTLQASRNGAPAPALPAADIAELPDLGGTFNDELVWRSHVARLALEGLAI